MHEPSEATARPESVTGDSERFRLVAEHASDIVVRVVDGRIDWVSPSVEAVTGFAPAELLGRTVDDVTLPADRPALDALHADLRATGRARARVRLITREGGVRWTEIGARVTNGAPGRVEIVAGLRDIDEEVAATVALLDSEARYRTLFANSTTGLAHCRLEPVADGPPDWSFLLVNDAFARITGLRDIIGRRASEYAPDPGGEVLRARAAAGRVAAGGPPEHLEVYVPPLGSWLEIDLFGVGSDEFVAAISNVTERKSIEQALAASRAAFEEAQRIAHVGSWTRDLATGVEAWSDELYRIYGLEPGGPVPSLDGPETEARCGSRRHEAVIEATIRTGDPWAIEFEIRRVDGSCAHVVSAGEAVVDPRGAITGLRGTVNDVTDLWAAREAARASEERFAAVFTAVRDSIAVQRPIRDDAGDLVDYEIEWVNDAWRERYGWTKRDPVGQRAVTVHPVFRTRLGLEREVMDTGRPQRADLELGDGRWIEADYSRFGDRLLVVSRDITARKAAEAALAESEERYRIVVTAMSEGVVLQGSDGSVRASNASAEAMLGLTAPQMAGTEPADPGRRVVNEDGSPFPDAASPAQVALRTGLPCRNVVMGVHKPDGSLTWILVNAEPILAPGSSDPQAVVTTFADITAQREAEEALDRARRMEMVGRLAAGVAHDFNNILTAINGYAEFLLGGLAPGDPLRADAAGIRESVARAAGLNRQLLAYGRRQLLRPELLDVDGVVAASAPLLRSLCGDEIRLRVLPSPVPAHVHADRGVIEQALVNLVLNARTATTPGGEVCVATTVVSLPGAGPRSGAFARVTVSDTGAGIEPELLGRIFEPFFTTKDASEGSGLGLSSVDGAIAQSGGFVTVDSHLGAGSSFAIHLPLVEGPVDAHDANAAPGVPARGSGTVLIVEDEPLVRVLARRLVASLGYEVVDVDRPSVALAITAAGTTAFDVVLTDLLMPEMNGRDLAERLRELRPGLPVVFMSGYSPDSVFADGLLPEGTPFLAKPFSLVALAANLRAAIDEARRANAGADLGADLRPDLGSDLAGAGER